MMEELKETAEKLFPVAGSSSPGTQHIDPKELLESTDGLTSFLPFKRWVRSLRAKKGSRYQQYQRYVEGWSDISPNRYENTLNLSFGSGTQDQQWESFSAHSSHLSTVKTSTLSIASQSIVRSRGTTQSTANQSIGSENRASTESSRPASSHIDTDAQNRAIRRLQALRELITTESDYVFGLKALTDVLLLFSTRLEIYHNLQQIRGTHVAFLVQIRNTIPTCSFAGAEVNCLTPNRLPKHSSSVDLGLKALHHRPLRTHNPTKGFNHRHRKFTADASEALEAAYEIGKLSMSFTAYREFCSHYEQLMQDMDLFRKSVPNWPIFEQGIEALSKSVASMESRTLAPNKSMCISDLLIKPIQRLCKYPLLLQELLKCTPIQDDPSAHDGIREILESVRNIVAQINDYPGNPINKKLTQQTLLLQGMLELPKSAIVHDIYNQLGPINLCGVLHVTYQSLRHLTGGYMVCVLFKNHFLLAKVHDDYRNLQAVLCLYTCDVKIDTPRNGKGLYCDKCYFSWKLVFQHEGNKFELVLSASCANEEKLWKTGLLKSAAASADMQSPVSSEQSRYSFLSLDLSPLDSPFRSVATLSHRPSVHSLAFSRAERNLQHVIIKKTHCPHKLWQTATDGVGEIERPKIPSSSPLVLTSRRQERVRLERVISPIYTRESLPYPGMVLKAGDIFLRPGSVMRRLTLHPGLHRRSSSANLPSRRPTEEPYETMKNIDIGSKSEIVRRRSEVDGEKGHILAGYNLGTIGRSKTLRQKSGLKQPSSADVQLSGRRERSCEHTESPLMRSSFRTMFNSVSLRRAWRNPREGLANGGG